MQSFCVLNIPTIKKSLKICVWITFYVYRAGMLQSKGWSRIMIKSRALVGKGQVIRSLLSSLGQGTHFQSVCGCHSSYSECNRR